MQTIGNIIKKYQDKKRPTSERAYVIEQLMTFMGEDKTNQKRFRYWLGRTRQLTPGSIYTLMREAREGSNPQALFNYFLKIKKYAKK